MYVKVFFIDMTIYIVSKILWIIALFNCSFTFLLILINIWIINVYTKIRSGLVTNDNVKVTEYRIVQGPGVITEALYGNIRV